MVNPRMKKKAAKVLMAYDSFWLKIGLETVFRMNLSPKPKGQSSHLSISLLHYRRELGGVDRGGRAAAEVPADEFHR